MALSSFREIYHISIREKKTMRIKKRYTATIIIILCLIVCYFNIYNAKRYDTWKLTAGTSKKDILYLDESITRRLPFIRYNDRSAFLILFCDGNRMITIALDDIAYGVYMPI